LFEPTLFRKYVVATFDLKTLGKRVTGTNEIEAGCGANPAS